MPKVSVIVPVYNAGKYLRQCLDSILAQSLEDIEVICVDDGSTDDSREILEEYAAGDRRLCFVIQTNGGPAVARNNGMTMARGKYIIFLDSDDWFEPDFLSAMYQRCEKNLADICVCKTEQFDATTLSRLPSDWMLKTELLPGEAFSPDDISNALFQFTYGQVWDKLYRREFLLENNLSFPPMRAAEDTAFVYKGLLLAKRIAILPEVKVHYRVNVNGSVSNSFVKNPSAPFDAFELIYNFLKDSGLYRKYEHSFLSWAMEYLVWQVCNMPDDRIRRQYFDLIRNKWFPTLGFGKNSKRFYVSKTVYVKYLLVRYSPFAIFSLILALYKHGL